MPFWLGGRRPRWVLAFAVGMVIGGAVLGVGLGGKLSNGGYYDPAAESSVARRVLVDRFSISTPQLVFVARARYPVTEPGVEVSGRALASRMRSAEGVAYVESYWDTSDPRLRADDGRAVLILVGVRGDDREVAQHSERLVAAFAGVQGDLVLAATGRAQIDRDLEDQSRHDLVLAELVAAPLIGLALLVIFGSVLAAALPLLVGLASITVTLGFLRLLAGVTDVSIFALNVTTSLGFALSISYSLFLVTRFREELSAGRPLTEAVTVALRATSRTIGYSALTVAVCLGALVLLPTYFFRSLGYAGAGVVLLAAAAAMVLVPAVLVLCGGRLGRATGPSRFALATQRRVFFGEENWKRLAYWVMRRPVPILVGTTVALLALALPFANVRFGHIDEKWLPRDVPSRTTADAMATEFPSTGRDVVLLVLPEQATDTPDLARYAADLSTVEGVRRVDSHAGIFADGNRVKKSPPPGWFPSGTGTWLQVITSNPHTSEQAQDLVRRIRAGQAPSPVLVTGDSAELVDLKSMLAHRLGWVALLIAAATFFLLFRFTGSVVLPVKALMVNVLVMAAELGLMVLVFQQGHLIGLVGGHGALGSVDPLLPTFMACVGFGVQLDYEIFLLAGIRERFLATGDNTESVAAGLARNGRLITSAACTLIIAVGALALSDNIAVKLIGVVLAAGLIIDATLIRILLVPAFMRLAGKWNWWAPAALTAPSPARLNPINLGDRS